MWTIRKSFKGLDLTVKAHNKPDDEQYVRKYLIKGELKELLTSSAAHS